VVRKNWQDKYVLKWEKEELVGCRDGFNHRKDDPLYKDDLKLRAIANKWFEHIRGIPKTLKDSQKTLMYNSMKIQELNLSLTHRN
jgi:hypothetical protein